jgi:hypothetical protein
MTWSWPFPRRHIGAMPAPGSPGAFGVQRKHHIHEGVDLHCDEHERVYTVEAGIVVGIVNFTGPKAGSPWWLDTKAVMVEGASGVVLYGEIDPVFGLMLGERMKAGESIGHVKRVLRHDKGAPTSMLHLELRAPGYTELFDWPLNQPKPDWLLDPTQHLKDAT